MSKEPRISTLHTTFPQRITEWEAFDTIDQLRNYLASESRTQVSHFGPLNYRVVMHKGRYVYAKCTMRGCTAALRYRLSEEGRLLLTKIHS